MVLAVPPLPGEAGKGLQNCCPQGLLLRSRLDAMWGDAEPVALPMSLSTGAVRAWVCLLSTPNPHLGSASFKRRLAGLGSINAGPDTAASLLVLAMGSQGTLEGYPPPWA